jgi:hypothetical protein
LHGSGFPPWPHDICQSKRHEKAAKIRVPQAPLNNAELDIRLSQPNLTATYNDNGMYSIVDDEAFFTRMRKLIGGRCLYLNQRCTLLEVMAEEAILILRCEDGLPPVQSDQFGHASRRVSETLQVNILDEDGDNLSADAMDLLASFEARAA